MGDNNKPKLNETASVPSSAPSSMQKAVSTKANPFLAPAISSSVHGIPATAIMQISKIRPMSSPSNLKGSVILRENLRQNIRDEKSNILISWSRLRENYKVEDRARERSIQMHSQDLRVMPEAVRKLIQTLKASVHRIMLRKGGTPFSIIREMFLYWDRDKSGNVTEAVLSDVLNSLGVKISQTDIKASVNFYHSGIGSAGHDQMSYMDLLKDVSRGEPSITAVVDPDKIEREDNISRYEMAADAFLKQPKIVRDFIDAVRIVTAVKMHKEGGTVYSHLRRSFLLADNDYSSGLNAKELILAMKKGLGLHMTEVQANDIIRFYDRSGQGRKECDYSLILRDVAAESPSMLEFVDKPTISRRVAEHNCFLAKEFTPKSNKTLESIKIRLINTLNGRILKRGGTVRSWMIESFTSWDPLLTGIVSSWGQLQGSLRSLGLLIRKDEADCIIDCFQLDSVRSFRYIDFINAVAPRDSSLIDVDMEKPAESASARTPQNVFRYLEFFRKKLFRYATLSEGTLQPRDVLRGTFVRKDPECSGRVSFTSFRQVADALQVSLSDKCLKILVEWFDSNGSGCIDYNAFVKQLFGEDALLSTSQTAVASMKTDAFGGPIFKTKSWGKTRLVKLTREFQSSSKFREILTEKFNLQSKLESVQMQSSALLHRYDLKRAQKA